MKTLNTLAVVLVSATVATAAFAKGPGGGMGGGSMAGQQSQNQYKHQSRNQTDQGSGQGTQSRTQTRDPASNSTGQPIQQRDRIHTPGTGITSTVPVTAN